MMLRTDTLVDVLASLYAEAEAKLTALIEKALASGSLGTARYRESQILAVRQLLSNLQGDAIPDANALIADSYAQGVEIANGSAPKVLASTAFTGVHEESVNAIADALTTKLNGAATNLGRRVDDIFRREGLRASALQLLEGQTTGQAAKSLAAALRSQGYSAFTDKAGREWGLANYASMVIRTTTREAATAGTVARLSEGGITQVRISEHTSACPICKPHANKVYDLRDTPDLPPYHPNCRCVATGHVADLADLKPTSAGGVPLAA